MFNVVFLFFFYLFNPLCKAVCAFGNKMCSANRLALPKQLPVVKKLQPDKHELESVQGVQKSTIFYLHFYLLNKGKK